MIKIALEKVGGGGGRRVGRTPHIQSFTMIKKFTKYSTAGAQMLDESPLKINAQFSILYSSEF